MHRGRHGIRLGVAATTTAALLLTGCGSSGDDDSDNGSSASGDSSGGGALRDMITDLREARDAFMISPGEGLGEDDVDMDEVEGWDDWQDWEDDPEPSPDAEEDPDAGGGGAERREDGYGALDVGAEINGVWQGADNTLFGVLSSQESGTGIANAFFVDTGWLLPDGNPVECGGLLFGNAEEGWNSFIFCNDEDETMKTAELAQKGDTLDVTWVEEDRTVSHAFIGDWDDAVE
ncbi:hypothetical protein [Streptomyces spiramenti]|uniref:Lipoprotein n=1 Tax=Streptomyces spiramenti TaxID=2720606 RepID=A0ABX1AL87_9ACTN|nr:hypothetical protein [Streptomyces spiramenti]NJP65045.1 hypothetical protein [Streptomyces spiramenti]